MTTTKRVSAVPSGGQTKRVSSAGAGTKTPRVGAVIPEESFLLTEGDVGIDPIALSGDMLTDTEKLLLSGDEFELHPNRTRRVTNG